MGAELTSATATREQFPGDPSFASDENRHTPWTHAGLAIGVAVLCGAAIALVGGVIAGILLAVLLAALITLLDYRVGLWFTILLLPFSFTALIPRSMFGIAGINPLNAALAATMGSLTIAWIFRPTEFSVPRFRHLWWLYMLPIGLGALHGTFYTNDIPLFFGLDGSAITRGVAGYLQEMFFKPAITLMVVITTAIVARTIGTRPGWLMTPVFAAATLIALVIPVFLTVSGVSVLTNSVMKSAQFEGMVGAHANEIGFLLNTAFALALFTMLGTRRGTLRIVLMGVIAIISMAVALTFSRGAYLGWLVVVGYLIATRRKPLSFLAVLVMMAAVLALIPPEIIDRAFLGVRENDVSLITSGRVDDIWLPLLPTLFESPIFGHGLGSVMWSEPVRRGSMLIVGHAHNAYLGLVLDLGIVGAVLVWMFWYRLWQLFLSLSRELRDPAWQGYFEGAAVSILVLLVQGLTDDRFTPTGPQAFIWVSAGIAFGLAGQPSILVDVRSRRTAP